MNIRKPSTQDERVLSSFLLIFIVFFGAEGLLSIFLSGSESIMHYRMTLSFLLGMGSGMLFYLWSKPGEGRRTGDKGMDVLKRALTEDEMTLVEIIRASEGILQEDLRRETGFSRSKVSVHLLDLEKKGLIERKKSGRTFKVYIGGWLKE